MADKKTGKSAASHKKVVKEFQKEGNPDFQKSGDSDFQPRASDVFQEKTGASQKPSASKSHAKKEYGETFGQNVQKSGADKGQEEKAAFTQAENTFSGQDNSGQTEENGERQEEKEDYHRRDTYRQSQEKGKYHKKRVQREHKHREKAKDTVFTEDAGKVFTEDCASEFTGSEKLKKKQKHAQKAAEQVKKARGKLPKKREYTLQRVFDEETGKGKYVVVPLDKEKPFKQESLSKTTMRRMQTESRNFVHGKIVENEKENSAVEGQNEQICRLKIRRMKEEWAKDLVVQPWCISEVVKAHEDCPELQAVLDEYHKPVVIQDQVLGELTLDKDYDTFEGEIQWCGKDVSLSLEVNAESKPSWTRARSAAKKLLADCDTWDKAMRELAAKNLTELANNWLSQDEENPRNPETDPITEDELARRISLTSLSVTSGGSFTAWFDCDEMFTDHAVTVYGSLKKGLKTANIEG